MRLFFSFPGSIGLHLFAGVRALSERRRPRLFWGAGPLPKIAGAFLGRDQGGQARSQRGHFSLGDPVGLAPGVDPVGQLAKSKSPAQPLRVQGNA